MDESTKQRIAARITALMPKEARSNYFQRGRGPMFVWTVEPFHLYNPNDVAQGRYESVVYVPVGKGSRSGKASAWKRDNSTASLHDLRKDAKARALRLFEEWLANEGPGQAQR